MQATADDLDLTPPPPRADLRAWALALLAHAALVAALAWGIGWQRDTPAVASAELWASVPRVAAPRAVEPEPPAPPVRAPDTPRPAPAQAEPVAPRAADIAVQRQREERRREQQAQREREQREREARDKAERERLAREQAAQRKAAQERAEREARARAEREREARERALAAQAEAERQRNLQRMLGQAGATGGPQARGSDVQDAAPSASYAGKLVAHIRPNIIFADTVPGNPRAEVEVRTLPDGTILSSRLLKSSGHRAWDEAVLRAIERTARLPRDEHGRVPPTLILGFRPNE
ncbi:IgA-specific serine endopeptidase autotransporter [Tepidimonas aquatica]|uniref:IgA-specific serine endopeptidase autotransporter n=2 Tax=Tepidimonas aquatica TaxID=247482 RepID=A0A554WW13_9BURK|nr:cell envelope integrity protein TolA [Tepidimonas aquatica]TSE27765.1 IgA-specific serine endopeptidase autotransporter [Tepidimonas aquatica]